MRTVPCGAAHRVSSRHRGGPIAFALATFGLLVLPSTVGSQVAPQTAAFVPEGPVAVAIEGAINGIDLRVGVMVVSRVTVHIDTNTRFLSPTGPINMEDLCGDPLPGRRAPGFVNGRANITGFSTGGVVRAAIVYVEPSEDLLIGPGSVDNGQVRILGRDIVLSDDPRMPGRAVNEVGFTIDPTTIPSGTEAVAAGYDAGQVFYAFEVVSDFARLAPAAQTLITRAQCSPDGELEVRGFSTHTTGLITVLDDVTNNVLGTVDVSPDAGTAGTFRFRIQHTPTCPVRVRLLNSNGSTTMALVEL